MTLASVEILSGLMRRIDGLVTTKDSLLGDLDISTMTVVNVKSLTVDMSKEDIGLLLQKELDGKARVSLTNYLQELLDG